MKITLTTLFFLLVLFSCENKITNTENEKLIRQYFEYFNKHDWQSMAKMYSEIADFKDPSLGLGIVKQTRQQTITKYSELNKTFPDLTDTIVSIYPSGENYVIVEFISKGTDPSGTKFELPICTIFTIENGVITKDFTYYDNFGE